MKRFILGLLCLFQILSPWVHAHTGGETGIRLHIPGLEKLLSNPEGYSAEHWDSTQDLIVSVQAGFSKRPDGGPNHDDSPDSLIHETVFPVVVLNTPSVSDWDGSHDALFERPALYETPPSRAPPSFS